MHITLPGGFTLHHAEVAPRLSTQIAREILNQTEHPTPRPNHKLDAFVNDYKIKAANHDVKKDF